MNEVLDPGKVGVRRRGNVVLPALVTLEQVTVPAVLRRIIFQSGHKGKLVFNCVVHFSICGDQRTPFHLSRDHVAGVIRRKIEPPAAL